MKLVNSVQERHPSPPDTAELERNLGALLDDVSDREAATVLRIHPAWVRVRRAGKKWSLAEVMRVGDHLKLSGKEMAQRLGLD